MMQKNTWLADYLWLFISISGIFLVMLGCRALSVPDEARYTEIPREMLFFHDFITPHLDGIKYFEKPPLLYWIQALVMHWFGMSEWILRLPTALMGVCGCLVTYTGARFLFDRRTGIFAAWILATSPLYFAMAHSITLDMTMSLWMTLTLMAFIVAVNLPHVSKARRYVSWLMYAAAALAVLTKGLVGILLPGAVIFTWLLLLNRWYEVPRLYVFSGLLIFLAIALPWHILVQIKNPEFFHFYFLDQQFLRYLTKAQDRYKPMWWFLPILLGGFFPWMIYLLSNSGWFCGNVCDKTSSRGNLAAKSNANMLFFLLWAVEIFIFFSISKSKLIPYIVPVLPPLAVLVAVSLSQMSEKKKCIFYLLAPLFFLLAAAGLIASFYVHQFSSEQINFIRYLSIIWIIAGAGLFYLRLKKITIIFVWLAIMQTVWLWTLTAAVPYFDTRSIKWLALIIAEKAKPNDVIVSYGLYYQDLPVYTKHTVWIVNWKNELTFGYNHQTSAQQWMMNQEQFWPLWHSPQHMFVVMDKTDYDTWSKQYPMKVLAQHGKDYLVTN